MPAAPDGNLEGAARGVLDRNRRGAWTCPSSTLYPHQWLWDSCFVAIGLARVDPERAAGELRALFRGQWANGMLPHIVFGSGTHDIGSRRLWQSKRNPLAPRAVDTSCITQPPLPAIAAWRVAQALPDRAGLELLTDLAPRLVAYHQWLYDERDRGSGLVTLIHPWECGLDTTPPWMHALSRMRLPWWLRAAERLDLARVVRRLRTDTRYLPVSERASDDEGLRMLVLATRAKRHGFRLRDLPADGSVRIDDVAFNAILAAANRALEAIARAIDTPLPPALRDHMARGEDALEGLWDDAAGQYFSRDAESGARIATPTVATFLPLWAGVPTPARAARLVARLREPSRFWPHAPVPSVPIDAPEFRETGYWKGPTWINMNWMIFEGLREYGYTDAADAIRSTSLALVERAGFSEYFSPLTGAGYGADDFSWTAALTLEFLARAPAQA